MQSFDAGRMIDAAPAALPQRRGGKRRMKQSRHVEECAWERTSNHGGYVRRGENRRMFWMLIGGATLFVVILVGVLLAMLGRNPANSLLEGFLQPSRTNDSNPPPSAAPMAAPRIPPVVTPAREEAAFLAEAEPLARKFLAAKRVEEIMPLVRNPGLAESRMRRHYPDGRIDPPGLKDFNIDSEILQLGPITTLKIRTGNIEEKSLSFVRTPQGLRIDWESWVGWSEMSWEEFLASRPTTPRLFRVMVSAVDYYNFAFADDLKWQSHRLQSADAQHAIYGYAERGSPVNSQLSVPPESQQIPLTLMLQFPEHARSNNQVLVAQCVAVGWALETEILP